MKKITKLFLVSVLFFYVGFCFADITTNTTTSIQAALNQATVAVADRSAAALQTAIQVAFSEVVVQMSGNPNEMSVPAIQKASTNLTRWVQSYAYIEQPNSQSPLSLQVVFDQNGLQKLLKNAAEKTSTVTQAVTSHTVTLIVSGVKSAADYVQVLQDLRAKNGVKHVAVDKVRGDQVLLIIKIACSTSQFQSLLAADNNFQSLNTSNASQLDYYWMGNQA